MIVDSELFGDLGLSFQREVGLVFRFFDGLGFITFYQAVLAACSNWGLARHCLWWHTSRGYHGSCSFWQSIRHHTIVFLKFIIWPGFVLVRVPCTIHEMNFKRALLEIQSLTVGTFEVVHYFILLLLHMYCRFWSFWNRTGLFNFKLCSAGSCSPMLIFCKKENIS